MPYDGTVTVFDSIREARRLIVERGWCKGRTQDEQGRVCLFWAIREATHGQNGNPLYELVCERVRSLIGNAGISPWNDAHTEDEVLALLDRAADPTA